MQVRSRNSFLEQWALVQMTNWTIVQLALLHASKYASKYASTYAHALCAKRFQVHTETCLETMAKPKPKKMNHSGSCNFNCYSAAVTLQKIEPYFKTASLSKNVETDVIRTSLQPSFDCNIVFNSAWSLIFDQGS